MNIPVVTTDIILPLLPITIIATISVVVFFKNRLKDRISALEQNFDVLQRLNEIALQSDDNVIAAVKSVCPDDNINIQEARVIFFQYLRIN